MPRTDAPRAAVRARLERLPLLAPAAVALLTALWGGVARLGDGAIVLEEIAGIDDLPAGWTEVQEAGTYRRIRVSFPVAGTLPLYLRQPNSPCSAPDKGDLEQYHPVLYS